eukprot:2213501-Prymnesium_polylepis.1
MASRMVGVSPTRPIVMNGWSGLAHSHFSKRTTSSAPLSIHTVNCSDGNIVRSCVTHVSAGVPTRIQEASDAVASLQSSSRSRSQRASSPDRINLERTYVSPFTQMAPRHAAYGLRAPSALTGGNSPVRMRRASPRHRTWQVVIGQRLPRKSSTATVEPTGSAASVDSGVAGAAVAEVEAGGGDSCGGGVRGGGVYGAGRVGTGDAYAVGEADAA